MKHRIVTLAVLLSSALLMVIAAWSPAEARRHDRYDDHSSRHWKNYNTHRSYPHSRSYYPSHHYYPQRNVVIIEQPRYERTYVAPRTYYEPSYTSTRVTCTQSYNPLPTLLGGAAGGVIGNQFGKGGGRVAATIGGALIGGMLGGQYGSGVQDCAEEVFTTAAPGRPVTWYGPNEAAYSVTPTRDYQAEGRYCREYQSVSTVGGQRQQTYGNACMQPDGSWEVVN